MINLDMQQQEQEKKDENSYDINVDHGVAKIIAQTICHEIKESIEKNDHIYRRAKRCNKQYNQITKWMEVNRVCDEPWYGAADYFIPLTEWVVDAVWSRTLSILFSQEPYMTAKGIEASDVEREDAVTEFIDMILREVVDIYNNTSFFFKQMINTPISVLRYEWESEFDTIIRREEAFVFKNKDGEEKRILPEQLQDQSTQADLIANSYSPVSKEKVFVSERVPIRNQPVLTYIKLENHVWDPNVKKGRKPGWEGDRFYLSLNDLMLKRNSKEYRKDAVDAIRVRLDISNKSGAEAFISQRTVLNECYKWYGRLPFNSRNEIDLQDSEAIEQEVCCIVDFDGQELLKIKHWDYDRYPTEERIYIRDYFEETEDFEGRSLTEKLYMTQKEMNQMHNTIINNAMLAMQKIFVKSPDAADTDQDELTVYPGAMWEETTPGSIRVLDVGDVKAIGLQLEQTFLNFAERLSNISIFQTGTARQEGGQKTKGEIDATIQEGNIGLDKFIQRCHRVMRKICKWTLAYYIERMPPGLERRILGDDGKYIYPSQENIALYQEKNINPYWSSEDIKGEFDFKWNGTSITADKNHALGIAMNIEKTYLGHPMIAGNLLATWSILRDGLIARGQKNWQDYLPKREQIIHEMKMQEAKVKKDKELDSQKAGASRRILDAVTNRGVPADFAMEQMGANV